MPAAHRFGGSGAEIRALEAGADAFVRKDEHIDVILARLNAVIRSAGAQGDRGTASLLGPKKVLSVDDSETYLQALAGELRGEGYEVVLARSGEEALQLLAIQPVDCILLDLLMPGIGGQETCRRVKSVPTMRDIPIIMLTALEDREAMIEGLGAGADDYIAKSSDFEVLRARVLAQIRRKQFEDENRLIRERLLRKELDALEARAAREMAEARAASSRSSNGRTRSWRPSAIRWRTICARRCEASTASARRSSRTMPTSWTTRASATCFRSRIGAADGRTDRRPPEPVAGDAQRIPARARGPHRPRPGRDGSAAAAARRPPRRGSWWPRVSWRRAMPRC